MRILIADDDAVTRRLLEVMLQRCGYEPLLCADGAAAWMLMQSSGAPALALIDWVMPEIDGLELCRRIRGLAGRPYVYIVILSSRTDQDDVIEGLEAGADDYLSKPVNEAELRARLIAGRRVLELQAALLASREQLHELAMRDALTELFTRRAIIELCEADLRRAARDGHSSAVIMADLDKFKQVNDTFGHAAGDAVLRETATRLRTSVRSSDYVGRYGGEEFLFVLPDCRQADVVQLAERILLSMRRSPVVVSGTGLPVTISLGISISTVSNRLSAAELIDQADAAMYVVKRRGGDGVAFAATSRGL